MKRLLCAALTVVMLFALCAPAVRAEETEALPQSYHAPTIKKMIDVNLQTGNTDEEFFHLLANAFLVDPAMVAGLLTGYTQDEITWLTKAIAYDLRRTDRVSLAAIPADADVQTAAMARLVLTQARDAANSSLDAFLSAEELVLFANAELQVISDSSASIQLAVPAGAAPSVAAPLNVQATVVSIPAASSDRGYRCVFYKTHNGEKKQAAIKMITVPANQTRVTVEVPISFTEPGDYTLSAEIAAVPSPISSNNVTVNVNGKWHITVELTADRTQLGVITLFDAAGAEVSHAKCLGKSWKNLEMNQEFGHTPIGVYTGYLDGPAGDTAAYGPYKFIRMSGQTGYVAEYCSHRTGLLIHGGREEVYGDLSEDDPNFRLGTTEGCVRIRSEYQLQLQNEITALIANHHETVGIITITQDGQITL